MIICHLPFGPTLHLSLANVVTRHDLQIRETLPEQYPHLIFNNLSSPVGERTTQILKHLFPPPPSHSKRVVTFANSNDWISFRHHMYRKGKGGAIELLELGPRFDMRVITVRRGVLEGGAAAGEVEFAYRPYMNSAKRKRVLGGDEHQGGKESNKLRK